MTDQTIPKKKRRTKEQVAADTAAQVALQLKAKKPPRVKKPKEIVVIPESIARILDTQGIPAVEQPAVEQPQQILKSPGVNIYGDFSITEVKAPKSFWQKLKDFLFS